MGETDRQVDNMEQSLELMLQCKYANWQEEVVMREGEINNEHTQRGRVVNDL